MRLKALYAAWPNDASTCIRANAAREGVSPPGRRERLAAAARPALAASDDRIAAAPDRSLRTSYPGTPNMTNWIIAFTSSSFPGEASGLVSISWRARMSALLASCT